MNIRGLIMKNNIFKVLVIINILILILLIPVILDYTDIRIITFSDNLLNAYFLYLKISIVPSIICFIGFMILRKNIINTNISRNFLLINLVLNIIYILYYIFIFLPFLLMGYYMGSDYSYVCNYIC